MSAIVGLRRPAVGAADIKSGEPVRAETWGTLGDLANWINGRGSMLIPWTHPGQTITSGTTAVFRFYAKPKMQTVRRVWVFQLRAAAGASADIAAPTGGTQVRVVPPTTRDTCGSTFVFFEDLSAQSTTAAEITCEVEAVSASVYVDGIACYEQSRASLALSATDDAVDTATLRARQPIIDRDYRSLPGVCDAYDVLDGRRTTLHAWSVPTSDAAATTNIAYQDLFQDPVPVIVANYAGSNRTMEVYCYVKATGGQMTVRATTAIGGSAATNTASSGVWEWILIEADFAPEDLTDPDGLPDNGGSPDWETLQIAIKCDTATNAEIAAVCVVNPSADKL